MKKWIIISISLLVIIGILASAAIYKNALDSKQDLTSYAESAAKRESDIQTVNEVDFYHGTETYAVVHGLDEQNEKWIAWVPEKEGKKIIVHREKDGWDELRVRTFVKKNANPKRLIDVRLGVEENVPVWEVSYIDQQDRYAFYYVTFSEGIFVKRYSINRDKS